MNNFISFHYACKYNLPKVVQAMVDEPKGRIDFNRKASAGWAGFHTACDHNRIELVEILVENSQKLGIDLNVQEDMHGYSGLKACRMAERVKAPDS